jgi:ABC-2 type transport system ATP-binding protein
MFNVPGVEIIRESGYEVKLELDVTVTSVARAIQTILQAAPVADISVEDPPLEQVIARIYAKTSSERGAPS